LDKLSEAFRTPLWELIRVEKVQQRRREPTMTSYLPLDVTAELTA